MITKPFDAINKDDIDILVVNQVRESRTLEYKETLPGNSDEEKREFLADVSSFANASGGDIVYGVKEQRDNDGKTTGFPEIAVGLAGINIDAEIRRLENMIRDGIEPRLPVVHMRPLDGFRDGPALLVRVTKSWASPHMVTYKNLARFFARNSAGKYQLDVTEIRSAFALSEALPERIRRFRDDRLAKVVADETPVRLKDGPRLVLHLVPIRSLDVAVFFDPAEVTKFIPVELLAPIDARGGEFRYNADGYLSHYGATEHGRRSYLQLFRSGMIEAVWADIHRQVDGEKFLPGILMENQLVSSLQRYLELLRMLGSEPPVFLQLSLIGVLNYPIGFHDSWTHSLHSSELIDRDLLILPDLLVEDDVPNVKEIMKPVFDAMWQASGWERSLHYDDKGDWIQRQSDLQ